MKRLNFLLVVFLVFAIVIISETTAFCEEYLQYEVFADSDFTQPRDICIDPGHGGPTAQKFGDNGDDAGTYGCCYNLSEQWVNLQVAYALRDSLYPFSNCPGQIVQGVIMTREDQTDIAYGSLGLLWRVTVANYANMGGPAYEFISIHHNGFPDTSDADQGTESWWWNCDTTDSGATRDTTSKLARKVKMKVRYAFNADAECYECYDDRPTLLTNKYVLRNSQPASVLSEASDIHLPSHWEEELLFMDSTEFWHATVEAGGIIRGWCSYKNNSGFVTIRNSAITGNDGYLYTDWGSEGRWIQWDSPYRTVWEMDEYWRIMVPAYQYIGDSLVYFHHIEELEHGYYSTDQILDYVVPQCSTHTVVVYWTGGPYSAQLYYPNGGEQWQSCEEQNIWWNASVGADSTTLIDLYISRDGGSNFDLISADLPNTGSCTWRVSGLASDECEMKIVAHDTAGNETSDVSANSFTIEGHSVTVTSPNGWETWNVGVQETTTWSCAHLCTTSYVDVYLSRDGGSTFEPIGSDLPNIGSYVWTVTGDYSNHCRIKVVVDDVVGNSACDSSNNDFSIAAPGNDNPVLDGHLQCKYPYEQCNECINWGDSFWLEILAHDPDGDSIYYEWHCQPFMGGHFSNGQNTMTTAENYVEYFAPAKSKDGGEDAWEVFLKVTVVDVRGGSNLSYGYLGLYDPGTSCICGDVHPDGIINSGDIVKLIAYVFQGESLSEPIERADVTNDCIIDSGDITKLIDYVFLGGSACICGWICP